MPTRLRRSPLILVGAPPISLVALAEQVRIELVHIVTLLSADVALPRVAFAVTAFVEEVQRLIGEFNAAEQALKAPFAS